MATAWHQFYNESISLDADLVQALYFYDLGQQAPNGLTPKKKNRDGYYKDRVERREQISVKECLEILQTLNEKTKLIGISHQALQDCDANRTLILNLLDQHYREKVSHTPIDGYQPWLTKHQRRILLGLLFVGGVALSICAGITGLLSMLSLFEFSELAINRSVVAYSIFSAIVYIIHDFQGFRQWLGFGKLVSGTWFSNVQDELDCLKRLIRDFVKPDSYDQADQTSRQEFFQTLRDVHSSLDSYRSIIIDNAKTQENNSEVWKTIFNILSIAATAPLGYMTCRAAFFWIIGKMTPFAALSVIPLIKPFAFIGLIMRIASYITSENKSVRDYINAWYGLPKDFISHFNDSLNNVRGQFAESEDTTILVRLQQSQHQSILKRIQYNQDVLKNFLQQYFSDYTKNSNSHLKSILQITIHNQKQILLELEYLENHCLIEEKYKANRDDENVKQYFEAVRANQDFKSDFAKFQQIIDKQKDLLFSTGHTAQSLQRECQEPYRLLQPYPR